MMDIKKAVDRIIRGAGTPSRMTLAEANECCGQSYQEIVCENCPLLIERREHPDLLQFLRAL